MTVSNQTLNENDMNHFIQYKIPTPKACGFAKILYYMKATQNKNPDAINACYVVCCMFGGFTTNTSTIYYIRDNKKPKGE